MAAHNYSTPKILKLPEVENKTGYRRSSIYLKVSQGIFPAPISLGARSVGWLGSEINEWILDQIRKSRSQEDNSHV
ncbi:MAG: phage transcriptional regulator, AlpA [Gammaproteobacteria bacterium]|jgi:prophage regulatory protein|nr:phage transcriptional regulator, AlpA [Gammaproteobacteria bacterium]